MKFLLTYLGIVFVFGMALYLLKIIWVLGADLYGDIKNMSLPELKPNKPEYNEDWTYPTRTILDNTHDPVKIKNLNGEYTFTYLDQGTIQELQKFGRLYSYEFNDQIIYRLSLNSDTTITISIIKVLGSYGYELDQWEVACFKRKTVKHVMGYLSNIEILTYVKEIENFILQDTTPSGKTPAWWTRLSLEG